jgi:hypothetical protein
MESIDRYALRPNRSGDGGHCLVFLHIPRTGGRTLSTVLRRNFPRDERCVRLNILDKPLSEAMEGIPLEKRARLRLLTGHLPYGVHNYVPRPCDYVTILRDPVKRLISVYGLIVRRRHHALHERVVGSRVSLEQYVESGMDQGQTHNSQTRQLSGRQFGVVDAAALDEAKQNVSTFGLVGLTERFEETIALLRRTFGLRAPIYLTKNVASPIEVSERTREVLREHNQLDYELYEFAHTLFLEKVREQGRSFGFEVSALGAWKPVARMIGDASDRMIRTLQGDPIAKRVAQVAKRVIR